MSFREELRWAERHLVSFSRVLEGLDLRPVRLACSLHLDLKMVPLLSRLLEGGCRLFLTSCNPRTTDADALACLKERGAEAPADLADPARTALQALEWRPTHLCELGGELSCASGPASGVRASMEGTGSGIRAISRLTLPYPVLNWDEVPVKAGIHNRRMVGLTTWMALYHRARLTLHGKRVVVIGYGPVGQGVAEAARAFGGEPGVVEASPTRRLQARFDGWATGPPEELLARADVVVTATGRSGVLSGAHFPLLKDGALLVNVGHRPDEIDVAGLSRWPRETVLPHLEAFRLEKTTVYLFAGGSMANLTAGFGDSLNAFDLTLTVMAAALRFMVREAERLGPGLHRLPESAWEPYLEG